MVTRLAGYTKKDENTVQFTRTDGKQMFYIKAYWDKSQNRWFQEGAPAEVLKENTSEVAKFFYNKFSFNLRGLADEISSRI